MEIVDLRSRAKASLHRSEVSISAFPTHVEMLYSLTDGYIYPLFSGLEKLLSRPYDTGGK